MNFCNSNTVFVNCQLTHMCDVRKRGNRRAIPRRDCLWKGTDMERSGICHYFSMSHNLVVIEWRYKLSLIVGSHRRFVRSLRELKMGHAFQNTARSHPRRLAGQRHHRISRNRIWKDWSFRLTHITISAAESAEIFRVDTYADQRVSIPDIWTIRSFRFVYFL